MVITYLTDPNVACNPEGCQKVAGGRSAAETTGSDVNRTRPWRGRRIFCGACFTSRRPRPSGIPPGC